MTDKILKIREAELPNPDFVIPSGIVVAKEEGYQETMDTACREWIDSFVESDTFEIDGRRMQFYYGIPQGASKVVVMVHGFCEFFGKYHELAWYLYQAGFGFFFMEQRGHGRSHREVEDKQVVHIDNFDDYVADMKIFVEDVVNRIAPDEEKILFGHSMGGCVSTLLLEEYPELFKKAFLSSPMLQIITGGVPKAGLALIHAGVAITHKQKQLSLYQGKFEEEPSFEESCCLSKARFDYQQKLRIADDNYQTAGGSFGWVFESLAATKKVQENFSKIKAEKVLLVQAGLDHLVDVKGYTPKLLEDVTNVKDFQVIRYEEAKHEVFNGTQPIVEDFVGRLLKFVSE